MAAALLLVGLGSSAAAPAPATPASTMPRVRGAADVAATVAPKGAADLATPGIANRDAWLYRGSDIAPDKAWQFGTLTNGLRYAVRKNGVPPGQVSIRVRIDAGSLMEAESERGYAHLIEHLSFRGSRYVPDGQAKRIWQRLGGTFGSDSNAQTTPTETFFKVDLPSASEAGVDESLKILSGMVSAPAITPEALAAERPAVLAEQREAPGPQVRLSDAVNAVFFAGQPLATRSPIGSVKTLEAATADEVRAFHDRWYRPERVTVVVVGDMDPALLERLVAANFASWKGIGTPPPEPDFGRPDPHLPATGMIVEPGLPAIVRLAVLRPWTFNNDTVLFNQQRLVDQVALDVINRRLEARARSGGSFASAQVELDDPARSANATFVTIIPIGSDWAAALRDVRAVIADAKAAPPSQTEIDRELADRNLVFATMVDTSRAEAGSKLADEMVEAVDIRETTAAPTTILTVFTEARRRRMFTPARVFAATRRVFEGTATRAFVSTPAADPDGGEARLVAALDADVTGLAGKRQKQAAVSFASLPALGPPGKIVSREKIGDFDTDLERVVFANGVRLVVDATTSETDRVYVRVRFGHGYAALPVDRPTAAWAGESALVASGIGRLGQGDIDQLTAGRRIGLEFAVDDDAFAFSAQTSPQDLSDQLRLIAAKLESPGWDPNPVIRSRAFTLAAYQGLDASPASVLERDLERLLHPGDLRWGTPSRAAVEATTPQSFRALWEPLLASGPIEVQVFGDIKVGDAIAAVARSIGALPARPDRASTPPPVGFPAHVAAPVVETHGGAPDQAVAVIAWPTGGGIDEITESRRLDVLAAIFNDRLFDRLRLAAGASYSPSVSSSWPIGSTGGGRLIAIGQVPPDRLNFFFSLAREIAADLVRTPVGADELQRTLLPMMQSMLRQATGDQFWMAQLAGAGVDQRLVTAFSQMFRVLPAITPADLQATARRYLRPDLDWTLEVVPRVSVAAAGPGAASTPAGPVR